jgi:hypothetical protein
MTDKISNYSPVNFWSSFINHWSAIYKLLRTNPPKALYVVNLLLDNDKLDIEFTIGQRNKIPLDDAKDLVEMYISPKLNRDSIPLMEDLYAKKVDLPNLFVRKYKPFHMRDPFILDIKLGEGVNEFKLKYDDIGVYWSYGYEKVEDEKSIKDEKSEVKKSIIRPLLNLVLCVKAEIAKKVLTPNTVVSVSTDNHSMRYFPTTGIYLMLLNAIGEYHLLNSVGYIECIPSNHELASNVEFKELKSIRDIIAINDKYN